MADPIVHIKHTRPMEGDPLAEKRQKVYADYKKRFDKMAKQVMKTHNTPYFEQVSGFLDSGKDEPDTLPACLLINKSDFANASDQIRALYDHLRHRGMLVIQLEGFKCCNLLRCASTIISGVSNNRIGTKKKSGLKKNWELAEEELERRCEEEYEAMQDMELEITRMKQESEALMISRLLVLEVEEPVVIIINNIANMYRSVLNDLLHLLVVAKMKIGTRYKLIMSMTGSIDNFHTKLEMSLISHLKVKTITLPSIRDAILAIIARYVLNDTFLIQPDPKFLCLIYEQVLMYNLSFNSFQKMLHYMNFVHINRCQMPCLLQYYDSDRLRRQSYERAIETLTEEAKKDFENRVMGEVTVDALDDLYCSHLENRKKQLRLYDMIEKIVFKAYPMNNEDRARSKLILNMFALTDKGRLETIPSYFKYFQIINPKRMIPNYEDFIKETVIPILRSQESTYRVELSNLEALCSSKSSNEITSAKAYSHLPANRLSKLLPEAKGEFKKRQNDYYVDFNRWLKSVLMDAFTDTSDAVQHYYYLKDINSAQRLNPDIQGKLVNRLDSCDKSNYVLSHRTTKGDQLLRDMRMVLYLANMFGRYVNIDKLLEMFINKFDGEENTTARFVVALVTLKNTGFFVRPDTPYMWRKTFYNKSSYRIFDTRPHHYKN